jgi:hypothetical protein
MAKKVEDKFEAEEVRDLANLEEKASEQSFGAGQQAVIGQRDEEGEVSLKEVYVNPVLRGNVAAFDDASGKEVTFVPGEKYSIDPKTAEKTYHGIPLFVDAE